MDILALWPGDRGIDILKVLSDAALGKKVQRATLTSTNQAQHSQHTSVFLFAFCMFSQEFGSQVLTIEHEFHINEDSRKQGRLCSARTWPYILFFLIKHGDFP